ncbi:hypothetical protein AB0F24_17280 [Streptomyces platensis]|uniref:hypothetical protein n=1 Tax=Streptomyces platensis TaxID=58346 RepID=UPI0033DD7526
MARIQILELPEGSGDDRPPFVLVIDEARVEDFYPNADGKTAWQNFQERVSTEDPLQRIADQIGARAVLVFEETVDIPANELTLTHVQEAADGNIVRLRVEPDLDGFTDKVMAEVAKAQADARAAFK